MSNYWGGHLLFDPADLERVFSEEDGLGELPTVWEELQEDSLVLLDQVKDLLDQLPPREADFIELYFFRRLRQTAIAELFNVSQPTVCYRLQRGAARLRYLVEIPEYNLDQMALDLVPHISDPIDRRIMVRMVSTTCQSEVARARCVPGVRSLPLFEDCSSPRGCQGDGGVRGVVQQGARQPEYPPEHLPVSLVRRPDPQHLLKRVNI